MGTVYQFGLNRYLVTYLQVTSHLLAGRECESHSSRMANTPSSSRKLSPEVVKLDVERPVPAPSEVLIRVRAVGQSGGPTTVSSAMPGARRLSCCLILRRGRDPDFCRS